MDAEKVSAADYQRNLDAELMNISNFSGDRVNASGLNAKSLSAGQGFAGELEQNALEGKHAG